MLSSLVVGRTERDNVPISSGTATAATVAMPMDAVSTAELSTTTNHGQEGESVGSESLDC